MSDNEKDSHHKKKSNIKSPEHNSKHLKRKITQEEKEDELRERLKRKYIEHELNSKKSTKNKEEKSSKKKQDKIKNNKRDDYLSDNSDLEYHCTKKKKKLLDTKYKSDNDYTQKYDKHSKNQDKSINTNNKKNKSERHSIKSNRDSRDNIDFLNNDTNNHRDDYNSNNRKSRSWDNSSKKELFSGSKSKPNIKKEEPNFALSGKLTEYTNTYNGVVIKYNEPPEARKPKTRWRLYPFKGDVALEMLQLHRQSAFMFGRDRKIADIPVDHPSCSKQQAILQFRLMEYKRDDGSIGKRVRPYVLDLESTNGTFLNNKKIEPRRYYEMFEKDVLKFGFSSRDYVLLHEKSKDDEPNEDDNGEDEEIEKKE
ncbi:uncharacterized protein LOC100207419 isoform X1 [Hydra vulgaris]|uniref:uncharacterized protein LOC100207419 isoform X1 n=1 Tax=Hydra vulgaris TaxID=6087 RepID=UPI0006415EFE|nr:FHA domain-containing protein DDL [Hydra vulgaris]